MAEPPPGGSLASGTTNLASAPRPDPGAFRILSPQEGDVYHVPAGVDPRYATLALRAGGGAAGRGVRWTIDGRPQRSTRWALDRGPHLVRAVDGAGTVAEVRVAVE
jgi:hypothetical protein